MEDEIGRREEEGGEREYEVYKYSKLLGSFTCRQSEKGIVSTAVAESRLFLQRVRAHVFQEHRSRRIWQNTIAGVSWPGYPVAKKL